MILLHLCLRTTRINLHVHFKISYCKVEVISILQTFEMRS